MAADSDYKSLRGKESAGRELQLRNYPGERELKQYIYKPMFLGEEGMFWSRQAKKEVFLTNNVELCGIVQQALKKAKIPL